MYILSVACMIVIVDQVSKYLVSDFFSRHAESIPLIPNIFHLTYVHNTGMAFGMFRDHPAILIVVIVVSLIIIAIYAINSHQGKVVLYVAYGFILGGAIGNLLDRLIFRYVIDFIEWYIRIGQKVRQWPTFNIADVAIVVGIGLMILQMVPRKQEKKGKEST